MQICKKINNNVALARDAKGRELVVFGKGIGFPAMPYELTDLSGVQRTFYDVNEKYFALLRDVPEAVRSPARCSCWRTTSPPMHRMSWTVLSART